MTSLKEFLAANKTAHQRLVSELANGTGIIAFWYKLAMQMCKMPCGRFIDGNLLRDIETIAGNNYLFRAWIFIDKCANQGVLVSDLLKALRAADLNWSAGHLQEALEAR